MNVYELGIRTRLLVCLAVELILLILDHTITIALQFHDFILKIIGSEHIAKHTLDWIPQVLSCIQLTLRALCFIIIFYLIFYFVVSMFKREYTTYWY